MRDLQCRHPLKVESVGRLQRATILIISKKRKGVCQMISFLYGVTTKSQLDVGEWLKACAIESLIEAVVVVAWVAYNILS